LSDKTISRHQLIICTKNRPKSLRDALNSCLGQEGKPDHIIVVDSSTNNESQKVVEDFNKSFGLKIHFVKSTPGLTHQRNIGIKNLQGLTEVVHFIDDDSILLPGYFRAVLSTFERHPDALGVGGAILNLPEHKVSKINLICGLDSRKEGKVLKSGINILNFTGNLDREVDWVSGCSMSFLSAVFESISFDERREGNSIGEDVDFCLRLNQIGKLYWTPFATLLHIQSPINRESGVRVRVQVVRHYLQLASDGLGKVKLENVYFSQILLSLIRIVKSIFVGRLNGVRYEFDFWKLLNE